MALIILAGGKSSRMGGGDKGLLPLGEQTMVGQILATLDGLFAETIVVAKAGSSYQDLPVRVIFDQYPGCGPISGIQAGLAASNQRFNLVLGCDLPLVQRELVQYLWERAMAEKSLLTLPEQRGRLEPLLGVYDRGLAHGLEAAILAGEFRLQQVLRRWKIDLVQEAELRRFDPELISFMNVNTPADYQLVRSRLGTIEKKGTS